MDKLFPHTSCYTAESVTVGHPDKVCDQISDAILDACLKEDEKSRVAVETFGSHGNLVIGGEVTTRAKVDYEAIAREVYRRIGYQDELNISVHISEQSPDIAQGVDPGGAGDQGIMYGYATAETPEFLPKGVVLAYRLARGLKDLREKNILRWLGPDGKTQVTIKNGRVKNALVSTQHLPNISQQEISQSLKTHLIQPVLGKDNKISDSDILINPTGKFVVGGFTADTGLTGRKIMVDTYGGLAPHGGGAFSGKDATKVDRSAAYMCRFVAKNLVAQGLAKELLVSVAYAIGRAEPLMVSAVNEKGEEFSAIVLKNFDFRPQAIIERLGLRRPIFEETAKHGHFTNNEFPWEKIEK